MPGETILGEKPYSFVPLLDQEPKRQGPVGHQKLNPTLFSGKITIKITALTPIHIFAGQYFEDNGTAVKKFCIRNGLPTIPGASLKGVVRSICEAVAPGCAPDLKGSLTQALPASNRFKCTSNERLCPTCRVFGFLSRGSVHKSQTSFGEMVMIEGTGDLKNLTLPSLNQPFRPYKSANQIAARSNDLRDGRDFELGNERLYYCLACTEVSPQNRGKCLTCRKAFFWDQIRKPNARGRKVLFRGRKFYYHGTNPEVGPNPNSKAKQAHQVVSAGTVFQGAVFFENLNEDDLALLSFGLGFDGSYCHKIGYAKPAYLGSARIELVSVENSLSRYGVATSSLPDLTKLAKQFPGQSKERLSLVQSLQTILDWENPKGMPWIEKEGNRLY